MKYSKYLSKNSLLQLLFVILMPTVTVAQSNTVSEFTLELVKNFEG